MFYKKGAIDYSGGAESTLQKLSQKVFHRDDLGDSHHGKPSWRIATEEKNSLLMSFIGMTFRFAHAQVKELIST